MIKKIWLMAAMISGSMIATAQNRSAFEEVKGEQPGEVIYIGPCSMDDINKVPAFDMEHKIADYKPEESTEKLLGEQLLSYGMVIYLGTWCDDSHRMIPQLFRVLKDVQYPTASLQIYALDHAKKGKDGEEQLYHITNVPTIILLRDGVERGRITEIADKSVESDLLKIIEKK